MNVFHIVSTETWDGAAAAGSYRPESLAAEGFIHFSYSEQVTATANRHYREVDGLQALEIDPTFLSPGLRVEPSPATGELFPHLYGPLPIEAVVAIHPLGRDDTGDYVFQVVAPARPARQMEQRISLVTLGVCDLARAFEFYRRLGWQGHQFQETVFFQTGGVGVILWDEAKLADDAGLAPTAHSGFRGATLAHNVRSSDEVDSIVAAAQAAGATITKPPADTFYGGYAGYFTDPDGHAWEVAYNPGFPISADGSITIPNFGP